VILLTGATGVIGGELLPALLGQGQDVRVLVRDPRKLGEYRVDVQITLGDLADPFSIRHAMRGVDTVIHLAATIRDQPGGTIEELNGLATSHLLRSAERAGAGRFVFFSAMGATAFQRTRFFRSKAIAERAVRDSSLQTTVFAPSIVYRPGDPWITLLHRLAVLPVMPVSGSGAARYQPIWAKDVARCVVGSVAEEVKGRGSGRAGGFDGRYELAGPEVLSYDEIVGQVLQASGRRRPVIHVPLPLVRSALRALELVVGSASFATWEEAELMEVPMTSERGTEDAERLGVQPRPMSAVLGG
jgi:uncharacterized protein YbjT (DUF2867 family)